jgi:hypothetical protein
VTMLQHQASAAVHNQYAASGVVISCVLSFVIDMCVDSQPLVPVMALISLLLGHLVLLQCQGC